MFDVLWLTETQMKNANDRNQSHKNILVWGDRDGMWNTCNDKANKTSEYKNAYLIYYVLYDEATSL